MIRIPLPSTSGPECLLFDGQLVSDGRWIYDATSALFTGGTKRAKLLNQVLKDGKVYVSYKGDNEARSPRSKRVLKMMKDIWSRAVANTNKCPLAATRYLVNFDAGMGKKRTRETGRILEKKSESGKTVGVVVVDERFYKPVSDCLLMLVMGNPEVILAYGEHRPLGLILPVKDHGLMNDMIRLVKRVELVEPSRI